MRKGIRVILRSEHEGSLDFGKASNDPQFVAEASTPTWAAIARCQNPHASVQSTSLRTSAFATDGDGEYWLGGYSGI